MDVELEQRLDESFYRDSQWVAENGQYIHENNGADSHPRTSLQKRLMCCSSLLFCSIPILRQTVKQ